MKIAISLTDTQVKGIIKYLHETGDGEKITRKIIDQYINGIVHATLECEREAVSDYIKREQGYNPPV